MSEANLWTWLKDVLPLGQYSRVESGETSPGFPDVDAQIGFPDWYHLSCKFELKYSYVFNGEVPFKNAEKGIHLSQKKWWKGYHRHHGTGWVIAEVKKRVYFIPPQYVGFINGAPITYLEHWSDLTLDRTNMKLSAKRLEKFLRGLAT